MQSLVYEAEAERPRLLETGFAGQRPEPRIVDPMAVEPLAAQPIQRLTHGRDPASDGEFLRQIAMSATLEARASAIARRWAQDPKARAEAAASLAAALAVRAEIERVAATADFSVVPSAFDAAHASQITQMRHAEAGGIEAAYRALMRDSRAKALRFAELYVAEGDHPALRDLAQARVRTLTQHLANA